MVWVVERIFGEKILYSLRDKPVYKLIGKTFESKIEAENYYYGRESNEIL